MYKCTEGTLFRFSTIQLNGKCMMWNVDFRVCPSYSTQWRHRQLQTRCSCWKNLIAKHISNHVQRKYFWKGKEEGGTREEMPAPSKGEGSFVFKITTVITITALCITATTKYFTKPVLWLYYRFTFCFWTTTWRAMASCPRYKIVQIKDNILKSAEDPCRNQQLLPLQTPGLKDPSSCSMNFSTKETVITYIFDLVNE